MITVCTEIKVKIYTTYTPAKSPQNYDIVAVYSNHVPCTQICDKLSKDLAMLTYIYLNVDEFLLTSSMPQQRFNQC